MGFLINSTSLRLVEGRCTRTTMYDVGMIWRHWSFAVDYDLVMSFCFCCVSFEDVVARKWESGIRAL